MPISIPNPQQRIQVWGLGAETKALIRYLRNNQYHEVIQVIGDVHAQDTESHDLGELQFFPPLSKETLIEGSVLVKSPGVSLYRPEVAAYRKHRVHLTDTISLWLSLHPEVTTLGITGSKGKSTTASMLYHMLKASGLNCHLAGNIGVAVFDLPEDVQFLILELSSYQTAILSEPLTHALILNLYEEHLDWHKDFETYRRDKLRIASLATESITLDANASYLEFIESSARKFYFSTDSGYAVVDKNLVFQGRILALPDVPLIRGSHTLRNLAALCTMIEALGIEVVPLLESLKDFKALPHRLEQVYATSLYTFINDSIATIPEATIAAMETSDLKKTAVIIGGYNRGLNWQLFAERLKERTPAALLALPESGHLVCDALSALESETGSAPWYTKVQSMDEAVHTAITMLPEGGNILLSPGAPSYGSYTNYQERGKDFERLARIHARKDSP